MIFFFFKFNGKQKNKKEIRGKKKGKKELKYIKDKIFFQTELERNFFDKEGKKEKNQRNLLQFFI